MTLLSSLAVPADCFRVILADPFAALIHIAEPALPYRVSLAGSLAIPADCFRAILVDPLAAAICIAKERLRASVSLVGGPPEPADSLRVIPRAFRNYILVPILNGRRNVAAQRVHAYGPVNVTYDPLRLRVALFGQLPGS